MTTTQLEQLASHYGLDMSAHSTTELIRAIQISRNDTPCFSTDKRYSCTEQCEWAERCQKQITASWKR